MSPILADGSARDASLRRAQTGREGGGGQAEGRRQSCARSRWGEGRRCNRGAAFTFAFCASRLMTALGILVHSPRCGMIACGMLLSPHSCEWSSKIAFDRILHARPLPPFCRESPATMQSHDEEGLEAPAGTSGTSCGTIRHRRRRTMTTMTMTTTTTMMTTNGDALSGGDEDMQTGQRTRRVTAAFTAMPPPPPAPRPLSPTRQSLRLRTSFPHSARRQQGLSVHLTTLTLGIGRKAPLMTTGSQTSPPRPSCRRLPPPPARTAIGPTLTTCPSRLPPPPSRKTRYC